MAAPYLLMPLLIIGEPIVCTVEDAFNYFTGTNLDVLVINNFILRKTDQKVVLKNNCKNNYELD